MGGSSIVVWDRRQRRLIREEIPDRCILQFLYGSALGLRAARFFFSRRAFTRLYAARFSGTGSRKRIEPFVRRYSIDAASFEDGPYASFNDFFARKFRPGARSFVAEPSLMPAFAEARYLAWESASSVTTFPVKGRNLTVEALLAGAGGAAEFLDGPILIARLAPQDYHRVHFADSGRILEHYRIEGPLHSINPIALSSLRDILATNAREVMIQETECFGLLAYVEVGAMTVGRIVQHCAPGARPARGQEKSHFELGASTVVVVGQPGRWIPDPEILDCTRRGIETFVELGTAVANAVRLE